MRDELKRYLIERYDGTIEPKLERACGNQILGNIVWVSCIDDYVINFLKNIKAEIVRLSRSGPSIIKINNENYQVVVADRENNRGRRTRKAYVDRRIPDDIMEFKVLPSMSLYCKEVKVF